MSLDSKQKAVPPKLSCVICYSRSQSIKPVNHTMIPSSVVCRFCVCLFFFVSYSCSTVQWWVTTLDKSHLLNRFPDPIVSSTGNMSSLPGSTKNDNTFFVQDSILFQEIHGYGAALTQSSASLFSLVKSKNQTLYWKLLSDLFLPGAGASISVIRLPITASDFILPQLSYYSYDDSPGDYQLLNVSLKNDMNFVIPVLLDILKLQPDLKVIMAPWSAPVWLKTSSKDPSNGWCWGKLADPQTYARYLLKVVQLYEQLGVSIFGLSLQNEPLNEPSDYPVMRMSPGDQVALVKLLGPLLRDAGLGKVRITIYDHNWDEPNYPIEVLKDEGAKQFIAGTAFHCYAGEVEAQNKVHMAFPDKELYFTECSGTGPANFEANIPWNTKNLYVGAVNNWATMVLHWNLALDENYNPHHGGCTNCRGVIRIGSNGLWADYNEEYYGVAHFGKFVRPGSRRAKSWAVMNSNKSSMCLMGIAFANVRQMQISLLNSCNSTVDLTIQRIESGKSIKVVLPIGLSTFNWED